MVLRSRAVAAIAVGLLLWQALAVGLVAARAAAVAADGYGTAVICHSEANSGGSSHDRGHDAQDCCAWCLATATPMLPAGAVAVSPIERIASAVRLPAGESVLLSPRAVRAGWSQPPPGEL